MISYAKLSIKVLLIVLLSSVVQVEVLHDFNMSPFDLISLLCLLDFFFFFFFCYHATICIFLFCSILA